MLTPGQTAAGVGGEGQGMDVAPLRLVQSQAKCQGVISLRHASPVQHR